MNLKNMLKRLTWNYNKNSESNVYKLFASISAEIESLKELYSKIEAYRGTDNATGYTLDLIGEDVRQERNNMSDDEYRAMLKFRSSLNRSNTDINSINTAMKSIISNNYVRMYEAFNHSDYEEPSAVIFVIKEYMKNINYLEIEKILAAGVRAIWRVEKEIKGYPAIATALIAGEQITVYPYSISTLTTHGKIKVTTTYGTGYDVMTVKPK